jgi:hypothetical protein
VLISTRTGRHYIRLWVRAVAALAYPKLPSSLIRDSPVLTKCVVCGRALQWPWRCQMCGTTTHSRDAAVGYKYGSPRTPTPPLLSPSILWLGGAVRLLEGWPLRPSVKEALRAERGWRRNRETHPWKLHPQEASREGLLGLRSDLGATSKGVKEKFSTTALCAPHSTLMGLGAFNL